MIDQLPQIPEDDSYTPVSVNQKARERITLDDLPPPGVIFQRSLTDREVLALKSFGSSTLNLLNEISKDMLPGIGEARALEYTNQEIDLFNKAVEERDVPGTIVHGVGVPIMSAGTLPYWLGGGILGGAAAFLMRDIIGKGYRNMTRKFRKSETARAAETQPDVPEDILQQAPGVKEAKQKADTTFEQKDIQRKIEVPLNFGETKQPIRTGLAKNVSEFQGSKTFDELAKIDFARLNGSQVVNKLTSLIRQGKISKDELFDAGIVKFDENLKPVGGALMDLINIQGTRMTTQDILKMLKNSPSNNLKIQHYGSRKLPDDFYDEYARMDILNASLKGTIDELIFKTTNTRNRKKLQNAKSKLNKLQAELDTFANRRMVDLRGYGDEKTMTPLKEILADLPVGDQTIMRQFISQVEKMKRTITAPSPFKSAAKHESTGSTKGGEDYRNTVIYLDETIPGQTRFVNPLHFDDPNAIVFSLKKTRYNKEGEPILFLEELQSDPIQKLFGEGKGNLRKMINNPYGKSLIESFIKNRLRTLDNQQIPLIKKLQREPLTDAEQKLLNNLDQEKAVYRKYFQRSELLDEAGLEKLGSTIRRIVRGDTTEEVAEGSFFPYINQYFKLGIREAIDDAVRTGKKGVAVLPVVSKGDTRITHHTPDQGHYLYYGDDKGLKTKAFDQGQLPGKGTKKTAGDAIYIETIKKIAKEIEKDYGLKLKITRQKIYGSNPKGSGKYELLNPNGTVHSTYKNARNRDYVMQKINSKRSSMDALKIKETTIKDLEARDAGLKSDFSAIVLELPDNAAKILRKKKMRSYKSGGLVAIEPKREYFAPIF